MIQWFDETTPFSQFKQIEQYREVAQIALFQGMFLYMYVLSLSLFFVLQIFVISCVCRSISLALALSRSLLRPLTLVLYLLSLSSHSSQTLLSPVTLSCGRSVKVQVLTTGSVVVFSLFGECTWRTAIGRSTEIRA